MLFTVTKVIDGDTFDVLPSWVHGDRRGIRVRIAGINTPERGQPGHEQAKQALSKLIFNKQVTLEARHVDVYGRLVGNVLRNGNNILNGYRRDGKQ